jgi:release factor glutamine methyltransferase
MPPETLRALLEEGRAILARQGIETAALDARLLLQAACGVSHEAIVAEPDIVATAAQASSYRTTIARRAGHEPVSRILGTREFFGRPFLVAPSVLDPRPETETVVDAVLERFRGRGPFRFLDLGTGSGIIAVTLICEYPKARGVATDVSKAALSLARENAARHGVADRLELVHANWFADIEGRFDLIASNPPYIRLGEIEGLAPEVRDHDPRVALDGGLDGLEAYRRIAAGARERLTPGGVVTVEIGAGQEPEVSAFFADQGFVREAVRNDLAGRPRCLTFR